MRITQIMNRTFSRISPEADFLTLLRAMRSMPSRNLYVVDAQDVLLGVISSFDALALMLPFYIDSNLAKVVSLEEGFISRILEEKKGLKAKDLMVKDFAFLREEGHFLEAEALLKERSLNALAVLDKSGRIVGEITRKRMLAKLIELSEQLNAGAR